MARPARRDPTIRELDERLTKVEDRLEEGFDAIDKRFDKVDERLDAIDGRLNGIDKRLDATAERLERKIDAAQDSNDVIFKVLLRQREDDRALADRRHAEVMAQFERRQKEG